MKHLLLLRTRKEKKKEREEGEKMLHLIICLWQTSIGGPGVIAFLSDQRPEKKRETKLDFFRDLYVPANLYFFISQRAFFSARSTNHSSKPIARREKEERKLFLLLLLSSPSDECSFFSPLRENTTTENASRIESGILSWISSQTTWRARKKIGEAARLTCCMKEKVSRFAML